MPVHKLDFGAFEQTNYDLIAIHTLEEDYKLAFNINKKLSLSLRKSKDELSFNTKEGGTTFSRYNFHDTKKSITWNLIQNKNEIFYQKAERNDDLFSSIPMWVSTKVYLLPEIKKADFLLKIEKSQDTINTAEVTALLCSINNVTTAYMVDSNSIKSKNNLTF